VAIELRPEGSFFLEVLHLDAADTVVLVTGDTDLAPTVRTAKALFPAKRIWFMFPCRRRNNELAQLADGHCYINKERYVQHQLPPVVTLATGRVIHKPSTWRSVDLRTRAEYGQALLSRLGHIRPASMATGSSSGSVRTEAAGIIGRDN
jgi:hypothetical protein